MAMPSRKKMVGYSLLVFILVLVALALWYFAPSLFTTTTFDEEGNPQREINLFPFGGGGGGGGFDIFDDEEDPLEDEDDDQDNEGPRTRLPRLRMVDEGPVVGATMFRNAAHSGLTGAATASTTDEDIENTIRYIELGSGHVYQASTYVSDIDRISNTTIPRINEAKFASSDRILLRYANDNGTIKTFSAQLVDNTSQEAATPLRLQGIFLPDDIQYMSVSPEGKVLSVRPQESGSGAQFIVSSALGENQTQISTSPLSEWRVDWFGSESALLMRAVPSYETFGMSYTLNSQNGATQPYTQARKALEVTPSVDRSVALVSMKVEGATKLFVWRQAANEYIDLGLSTFAEKCVWAQARARFYCAVPLQTINAAEPDLWYQGVTQYRDEFWEINPETGRSRLLLSPTEYNQENFDVVDLQLSPDEQFLYFRDKLSRALWTLQIDYERSEPASSNNEQENTSSSALQAQEAFENQEQSTSTEATSTTAENDSNEDQFFE